MGLFFLGLICGVVIMLIEQSFLDSKEKERIWKEAESLSKESGCNIVDAYEELRRKPTYDEALDNLKGSKKNGILNEKNN